MWFFFKDFHYSNIHKYFNIFHKLQGLSAPSSILGCVFINIHCVCFCRRIFLCFIMIVIFWKVFGFTLVLVNSSCGVVKSRTTPVYTASCLSKTAPDCSSFPGIILLQDQGFVMSLILYVKDIYIVNAKSTSFIYWILVKNLKQSKLNWALQVAGTAHVVAACVISGRV